MDQLTMTATEARDEAIQRVDAHADPNWKELAKAALWATLARLAPGEEFTTDDVDWPPGREPRAHGPIMLAAAKAGLIVNTHRVRPSNKVRNHACPKAIWQRMGA